MKNKEQTASSPLKHSKASVNTEEAPEVKEAIENVFLRLIGILSVLHIIHGSRIVFKCLL